MNLTRSQKEALKRFNEFLCNDHQVFILNGAAGTGKTTILKHMIGMVNERYPEKERTILLAPTGRAAHILRQKTGQAASTIHKLIYSLKGINQTSLHSEDQEKEKTEIKLRFMLDSGSKENGMIYFVDEASLISNAYSDNEAFQFGSGYLLNDLLEYVRNNKIVFIGDSAQLPPIGMNISPALDPEYLKEKYGVPCDIAVLSEVVRQTDKSGILQNATKVRQAISDQHFAQFRIEDSADVRKSNDLVEDFISENREALTKSIIVTYRNIDARDYNISIRKRLYGKEVARLIIGDLLVVSRNNYLKGELFNGTIVKVERSEDGNAIITRTINVPKKEKKDGKVVKVAVELRFRPITIAFQMNGQPCRISYLMLDNFLDSPEPQLDRNTAVALYLDFKLRHPNLKPNSKQFNEALVADEYFNALLCKYGYALTCHKAQGGEWEKVFVDMNRVGGKNNENYFRWAYTAITRGSKKLWHYNSPEFDVFSNMTVAPIIKGGKFVTNSTNDYKEERFNAIKAAAERDGVNCEEDLSIQWQHRITFTDNEGRRAWFALWYGSKGYSNRAFQTDPVNNPEFAAQCRNYLLAENVPEFVFNDKGRKSARILHNHILSILNELGIQLVNVVNKEWQDVYYLKTTGHSVVEFSYNGKGNYSFMRPLSDLGSNDELLKLFCEKF